MIFTGYNPYAPPRATPPTAADLPDVGLGILRAAQGIYATHLSADGLRAYCSRYDVIFEAEYDGARFGSWWPVSALPADVVRMP